MKIKRIVASLAAASTFLMASSVTASAETVANDDLQEISVALSVEEFADLASDYGVSVSIGDNGSIAEPQKHEDIRYVFTDSAHYHKICQDSALLPETVQLQNITFSDNIESISIDVMIHTTLKTLNPITEQHSNSETFGFPIGCIYSIHMKANPKGQALSTTNTGWVSFYWTDRGWEIE